MLYKTLSSDWSNKNIFIFGPVSVNIALAHVIWSTLEKNRKEKDHFWTKLFPDTIFGLQCMGKKLIPTLLKNLTEVPYSVDARL